jgi:SAM-dependent methyltransferase
MIKKNIDKATVEGFGDEWERFDQSLLPEQEQLELFNAYFSVFPWGNLPPNAVGFDLGCGSGRWAKLVAPRVGVLHCIDPSSALQVAKKNLVGNSNCEFHLASANELPFGDCSMDFGYSLGVLHHIPDTEEALVACVKKLKPGAPFLVYLYYAFDNRPFWFRWIWKLSEVVRFSVSRLPHGPRYFVSQIIAVVVYLPFARSAYLLERMGYDVSSFPLSAYRRRSFYTIRTDALDRFGTRLEQRFTQYQLRTMMEKAGLEKIVFSSHTPYWCAVGLRKDFEDTDF